MMLKNSLVSIIHLFRDLILTWLPPFLAQLIAGRGSYAFIVHPRDLDDHVRKYPFAIYLPEAVRHVWSRFQWAIVGSKITGLVTQKGKQENGWIIICPMTTRQMIKNKELARKRVLQSVRLAEKLGARIVGLGAFTSIVTDDGKWLVGKAHCGLTTGNAYSAAIAVENLFELLRITGKSLDKATVAVVGAVGSEGSACTKLLVGKVAKLILVDKNVTGGKTLVEQLSKGDQREVTFTTQVNAIKEADAVIAVTNAPGAIVRASHLKPGAVVIDAAQPKNVSRHVPIQRQDVLVVESAIVKTPGVHANLDLGLRKNEALGCLAETQILTWIGHTGNYSLGKADPRLAEQIARVGEEAGYKLAPFRNSLGCISDDNINQTRLSSIEQVSMVSDAPLGAS